MFGSMMCVQQDVNAIVQQWCYIIQRIHTKQREKRTLGTKKGKDDENDSVEVEKTVPRQQSELNFEQMEKSTRERKRERRKERGEQGPSRWQETVATETQRGENNEGLEWCFMSHHNAAMSLSVSNIAAPSNPIYVKIRTLKITIFGFP